MLATGTALDALTLRTSKFIYKSIVKLFISFQLSKSIFRFVPYVVSLVAMKLTVMMLLASNKRNPERMEALSADSSMGNAGTVLMDAPGEEELKNRRYWQMLGNLEEANIEASATNRTHPSSIWYVNKSSTTPTELQLCYYV